MLLCFSPEMIYATLWSLASKCWIKSECLEIEVQRTVWGSSVSGYVEHNDVLLLGILPHEYSDTQVLSK